FMSYNAYPHYPNFISQQSDYLSYSDSYGANSYKGYLRDLKAHYSKYPLIITEYGASSSWGVAHYTQSGMNYGGFDEAGQGNANLRMLETIEDSHCGGGIQFAWMDEWFKPTWISHPIDQPIERRILWHNIAAAEQNFGLISFNEASDLQSIKRFRWCSKISELKGDANYTFFELEIALKRPMDPPDEMWIALDTYADELGESLLPGGEVMPFRSEFLLHLKDKSATLYVTEAYDIYGIGHHNADQKQVFHSIASEQAPWHIVRWKNNSSPSNLKHIGNLQVNYEPQKTSSKDAVMIRDDKIHIRLPWSLLNVVAPHQLKVLHDDRFTPEREDTITEGFNIGIYYKDKWFTTDQRFLWTGWDSIDHAKLIESRKISYQTTKSQATQFNTAAIAMRDTFVFENKSYPTAVDSSTGVLKNDFDVDVDGKIMVSLMAEQPRNGQVDLNNDGSFSYCPKLYFNGIDSMKYVVFDGHSLSEANTVVFNIKGNNDNRQETSQQNNFIVVSQNPASSIITIQTVSIVEELSLFNASGQKVHTFEYGKKSYPLDLSNLTPGVYMLVGQFDDTYYSQKVLTK
ncbi:MAG: cadherin-like domain-containing protein, partial [Bacteroidales bacterium]|nr:cadherin-like domain-containing protein [Bacteroidales bacterium]